MSDKKTEELFEKALSAVVTATANSPRRGPRFFMTIADPETGGVKELEVPNAKRFSAYVSGIKNPSKIQTWFAYHDLKISHWDSGRKVMDWHPPFGSHFDAKDAKKAVEAFNKRVPQMGDVLINATRDYGGHK